MSPWLLAELYRSSLIDPGETTAKVQPGFQIKSQIPQEEEISIDKDQWKLLGENKKNILIVVRNKGVLPLPENEMRLLNNMLAACKLSMGDVILLDHDFSPLVTYKELLERFNSRVILLFGTEPADLQLPIRFPHFQIQPFANGSFLFIPGLKEIAADEILKSKLWVSLRRLFAI